MKEFSMEDNKNNSLSILDILDDIDVVCFVDDVNDFVYDENHFVEENNTGKKDDLV